MRSRFDFWAWELSWETFTIRVRIPSLFVDSAFIVSGGTGTVLDLAYDVSLQINALYGLDGVPCGLRPPVVPAGDYPRLDRWFQMYFQSAAAPVQVDFQGPEGAAAADILGFSPSMTSSAIGFDPQEIIFNASRPFKGAFALPPRRYSDTRTYPEQQASVSVASSGPPTVVVRSTRVRRQLRYEYCFGAELLRDRAEYGPYAQEAGLLEGDAAFTFENLWDHLRAGGVAKYFTIKGIGGPPGDIYDPNYWGNPFAFQRPPLPYTDPEDVYMLDPTQMNSIQACLEDQGANFNSDVQHLVFEVYRDQ